METFKPSVFTPFLRRFTDERARDLGELQALYREVHDMHLRSKYSNADAVVFAGVPIYTEYADHLPTALTEVFALTLNDLSKMETAIFGFPEIKWNVSQLSLKEQVDLERFLTTKRHFLTNQARVMFLFLTALNDIFGTAFRDLPEFSTPSPFTIPFIFVVPEPKKVLDRIYGVIWNRSLMDNGLFVDVSTTMHLNMCEMSGIDDPQNPKRAYKLPSDCDAPLDEVVNAYFKNTPFEYLFMAPVPLKLTHEDRFSH